jgi:three-Cys-motif partner protein
MSSIPPEYHGREQSWLKHRVLEEYLEAWSHKLGGGKFHSEAHLWYVDVFAGPWRSARQDLADTSIFIGLTELCKAANTWRRLGRTVRLHAIFVEKERSAFAELEAFTGESKWKDVDIHCFHGEFGEQVETVGRLVGQQPALIFVDPTGWKGAALRFISPLVRSPRRDVLINVMYDHLNRFKDDERPWLREQIDDFFGLEGKPLPNSMNEDELMQQYRERLKDKGSLPFVADLAIPMPQANRTKFRLVVGGHSSMVLRVFRDVEATVIGREAAEVAEDVRQRMSPQVSLFSGRAMTTAIGYARANNEGIELAGRHVLSAVSLQGQLAFKDLWPAILAAHHLRYKDLTDLIHELQRDGKIAIENMKTGERVVKDEHNLRLGRK